MQPPSSIIRPFDAVQTKVRDQREVAHANAQVINHRPHDRSLVTQRPNDSITIALVGRNYAKYVVRICSQGREKASSSDKIPIRV